MIVLSRDKTPRLARAAVAMYTAHKYGVDPVTTTNSDTAVKNLLRCFADPTCVFISAYVDGVLAAWLLAKQGVVNLHSNDIGLTQLYYVSSAEGFRAARLLYACHDALYDEGVNRRVSVVVSGQSHMDTDGTLVALLARHGWARAGHLAYRRVAVGTRPLRPSRVATLAHCGPL